MRLHNELQSPRPSHPVYRAIVARSFLALTVVVSATARAEHRVALLIGVDTYEDDRLEASAVDLAAVAKSLESRGFRCRIERDPKGERLRDVVDRFVAAVPTRGTALVYFTGEVRPGKFKNDSGAFLVGSDTRADKEQSIGQGGYHIERLLERLAKLGGGSANLVFVDPVGEFPEPDVDVPESSLLAAVNTAEFQAALGTESDFLGGVRSASAWVATALPSEFSLSGIGDDVVAGPETFVEGRKAGDKWVNGRGMVFCWCPPGKYVAGSPDGEPGRYPDEKQREVVIEHGFWIGKYEMTLRENVRNLPRGSLAKRPNDPLTMINHDDAKRMTTVTITGEERKAGRLPEGWQYSLPTPEQWEYAARAGTRTAYSFGDDVRDLPRHANFGDLSYYDTKSVFANAANRTLDDGAVHPVEVGSYAPNAWGLHDVHGNVAEWCIDQSIRGGSWVSPAAYCRSAHLDRYSSRNEQPFIGYRLVIQRVPPPKPKPGKK